MKHRIVILILISFVCVSFGQEITYKKQQPCDFIIHHNDIVRINIDIDIDTIIDKYGGPIPKFLIKDSYDSLSYSIVIVYKVKVYLTDDCISRITNADWSVLCSVLIEGSDYSIGIFPYHVSLMLWESPTLYNYSPDRTKFVMFNKYLQFSFSAEFAQSHPSFFYTLISIKKNIQFAEEYND